MNLKNILFAIALPSVAVGNLAAQGNVVAIDSLPVVYYTDGVRLATEGSYAAALEKFEQAIAKDPDHDPSLYEAANALARTGRPEKALEYSARAAALDPGNDWYRGQQVNLLASLSRIDEALAVCEEMVSAGSGFNPENYRMLALLYYSKGRTDEALATLDSVAVRMGPSSQVVEMKRGFLLEAGRIAEAAAVTESYIAAAPYDEENRMALAEIYAYEGRDSLRTEMLRQVVGISPDNADALGALADAYRAQGKMELFFATLKQLFSLPDVALETKTARFGSLTANTNFYRANYLEIDALATMLVLGYPGDAGVLELYTDHAVRGGNADRALDMLKSRLERPDPPLNVFMQVIEIEAYMKRADSVEMWSDRALERYPDEIGIYLLRSSALQFLKRPADAQRTLTRALKVATNDSLRGEVYGAIGTLWHEEGNLKKTFAAYEKALRYNSDNALVLNNYAYYLAEQGRQLDRALGMAQRAVRLKENFATYLDTYAWVLYKTGDYAEARRVMQQALPLDVEGNPELMLHYGDILWALGEKFMATVYWKKARDAGWEPASDIEERLSRE